MRTAALWTRTTNQALSSLGSKSRMRCISLARNGVRSCSWRDLPCTSPATVTSRRGMKWADLFKDQDVSSSADKGTPSVNPDRQHEEVCARIVDQAGVSIFAQDLDTREYVFANPAFLEFIGKGNLIHVLGKTDEDLFVQETVDLWKEHRDKLLKEGQSIVTMDCLKLLKSKKEGKENQRWGVSHKLIVRGGNGHADLLVGIITDVSAHQEALQKTVSQPSVDSSSSAVPTTSGPAVASLASVDILPASQVQNMLKEMLESLKQLYVEFEKLVHNVDRSNHPFPPGRREAYFSSQYNSTRRMGVGQLLAKHGVSLQAWDASLANHSDNANLVELEKSISEVENKFKVFGVTVETLEQAERDVASVPAYLTLELVLQHFTKLTDDMSKAMEETILEVKRQIGDAPKPPPQELESRIMQTYLRKVSEQKADFFRKLAVDELTFEKAVKKYQRHPEFVQPVLLMQQEQAIKAQRLRQQHRLT
eukprot:g77135.t1